MFVGYSRDILIRFDRVDLYLNGLAAFGSMEHTGPGLWSDSVFSYLLARYGITWHDLRALDHPMRIGEVLVLPITAFSPGGQPDFKAKGRDDEQADVVHDFRGSWKAGGL